MDNANQPPNKRARTETTESAQNQQQNENAIEMPTGTPRAATLQLLMDNSIGFVKAQILPEPYKGYEYWFAVQVEGDQWASV